FIQKINIREMDFETSRFSQKIPLFHKLPINNPVFSDCILPEYAQIPSHPIGQQPNIPGTEFGSPVISPVQHKPVGIVPGNPEFIGRQYLCSTLVPEVGRN